MRRGRTWRGFTLLEVMISLAILSVALVAIGDVNGTAVRMHQYAKQSTVATLLARAKMEDLEEKLQKDGFSDFDDELDGTFDDEGWPEYRWSADILKPDIQLDAGQLMSMIGGVTGIDMGQLMASSSRPTTSGVGGLLAAAGPFAGIIQSQITAFVEELKKSVREIHLTVSWGSGAGEHKLEVATHMVILPGMIGKTSPGTTAPNTLPTPNIPGMQPPVPLRDLDTDE